MTDEDPKGGPDEDPKGGPDEDPKGGPGTLAPGAITAQAGEAAGSLAVQTQRRKATLGDLWAELRRRRVFRALVGYGIFSFAVLQVSEPVMHGAHLPDWVLTAVLIALAIGFPVAVVLAWVFDLTTRGVKRTPSDGGVLSPAPGRLAALLVGIGLAAALPGVGWYAWKRGREAAAPAPAASGPSIAVLPFADLSPNHDQTYFSDGIAEEILNALSHVQGLKVIGRTSSFSFRGKGDDLRAIGHKLGVAAVLEGSVRKVGSRVRITVQLVDVRDGYHRWSQSFDRELTDIFAVQEEIARSVVDALKVKLLPGRGVGAVARRATNPEAYAQYLLGKQLQSRQSMGPAIAAYTKALQLDPQYAPAHAALAYAVVHFEEFDEVFAGAGPHHEEALAAAEKAVALAPDQPDGYATRGMVKAVGRHDWDGALADLEHAVALNPGDAGARRLLALIRASLGRLSEAIAATREATELDPLSTIAWNNLGWLHNATGELGLAREALQRSLALQPQQAFAHFNLGNASLLQGRPAGALEDFDRSTSEPLRLLGTALAQHDLGHPKESQQALDTLIAKFGTSASYRIARVYAWRGEADRAFEWLERAYARRNMRLLEVKFDPLLRNLRDDPRYAELLRRMNLPVH